MRRPACIALVLALAFSRGVFAQEDLSPEEVALFEEDVLSIFEENCFKCRDGGDEIEGGLVLTSQRGLLRGGNRGPVVDRKTPESSFLLVLGRRPEKSCPKSSPRGPGLHRTHQGVSRLGGALCALERRRVGRLRVRERLPWLCGNAGLFFFFLHRLRVFVDEPEGVP